MDPNIVLFGVAGGLAAVVFAIALIFLVLRLPTGNDRMREIAAAIQEGASAYLNRQYMVIAIIGVIIAIVIGLFINWTTATLFVVGAVLSAAAGYVGMNIAVRSNLRTAEAARGGLNQALQVAFRGGAVTGFMVVGLGLLGVSAAYFIFRDPDALVGLAFGASLVSVFARLGGGIYTKA
ncbi:MAG TPA: sodium/proton-translocating pyrophosphatase, partial [Candidatus Dormibacteraeota bacterium]|nr:sodium/proton-translocating pyrophosphatase [Candidatus Dormibacteraeota bacterium]